MANHIPLWLGVLVAIVMTIVVVIALYREGRL